MKHLFNFLMMMLCMFAVDPNDGGGGGDGSSEVDDWLSKPVDDDKTQKGEDAPNDTKPPAKEPPKDVKDKNPTPPKEDNSDLEKRLKRVEELEALAHQKTALAELTSELSSKYPGFNMKKVTDKLDEIEKKSPGRGNALFTPEGIEFIWKSEFQHAQQQDPFDDSRSTAGQKDEQELIEKIRTGKATLNDTRKFFERWA